MKIYCHQSWVSYRNWSNPRPGSTSVSTVLRKSVRFFIRNLFLTIRTFQVEIWKMVWTNVFFFQFLEIWCPSSPPSMNQKPGKANFRELVYKKIPGGACPRAPLEACSLGPLFRKSVSINFILDRRLNPVSKGVYLWDARWFTTFAKWFIQNVSNNIWW